MTTTRYRGEYRGGGTTQRSTVLAVPRRGRALFGAPPSKAGSSKNSEARRHGQGGEKRPARPAKNGETAVYSITLFMREPLAPDLVQRGGVLDAQEDPFTCLDRVPQPSRDGPGGILEFYTNRQRMPSVPAGDGTVVTAGLHGTICRSATWEEVTCCDPESQKPMIESTTRRSIISAVCLAVLVGAWLIYALTNRARPPHDEKVHVGAAGSSDADQGPAKPSSAVDPGVFASQASGAVTTEDETAQSVTEPADPKESSESEETSEDWVEILSHGGEPIDLSDFVVEPEDRDDHLMAAFDVNSDGQADLIVFEKAELQVSHILLGKGKGDFEAAPTTVKVPEYIRRFLAAVVEKGTTDGSFTVQTKEGTERRILLLGEED